MRTVSTIMMIAMGQQPGQGPSSPREDQELYSYVHS